MLNAIIPECYVDTCLINILLSTGKNGVNHAKGNSSVARKMKDHFGDAFAVGIIDRDKREVDYIKEFDLKNETLKDKLLLFKHPNKHHYIIQLCPESETWICNVATDLGINMQTEYDLPGIPKLLSKFSKDVAVAKDDRFVRLFREILRKSVEQNYEPVNKLIYWLTELIQNTYNVNIGNLTN